MELRCEECGIVKDSFSMPMAGYGRQLCWDCKKKEDERKEVEKTKSPYEGMTDQEYIREMNRQAREDEKREAFYEQ